ncbi:hypothetical protein DFP72DRAFT_46418 [Ephemerocybe angulata]|uniref:Uncharacterized protein n=1 Tax=Ephemerocybe angulata TaxID=980116 RepID=A0A8H6LWT9_9AGAR|nr:hypothetical protein DFP72DRAFT_46418 [Tulosesus angulatus]
MLGDGLGKMVGGHLRVLGCWPRACGALAGLDLCWLPTALGEPPYPLRPSLRDELLRGLRPGGDKIGDRSAGWSMEGKITRTMQGTAACIPEGGGSCLNACPNAG